MLPIKQNFGCFSSVPPIKIISGSAPELILGFGSNDCVKVVRVIEMLCARRLLPKENWRSFVCC